jgi:hypothetical protein
VRLVLHPPLEDPGSMPLFEIASAARRDGRELLMRKFGHVTSRRRGGRGKARKVSGRTFMARSLVQRSGSVRPAPLAVRAKVVSWRACPPVEHRMATTTRAAPPSWPTSFRNRNHHAVGLAAQHGCDRCTPRGRKTKGQRGSQICRSHCHVHSQQLG